MINIRTIDAVFPAVLCRAALKPELQYRPVTSQREFRRLDSSGNATSSWDVLSAANPAAAISASVVHADLKCHTVVVARSAAADIRDRIADSHV